MAQVAERLGEPPVGVDWRERVAVDRPNDLEGRHRPILGERVDHAVDPLGNRNPVGRDVRWHFGEAAAVAGQAEAHIEIFNYLERT